MRSIEIYDTRTRRGYILKISTASNFLFHNDKIVAFREPNDLWVIDPSLVPKTIIVDALSKFGLLGYGPGIQIGKWPSPPKMVEVVAVH